MNELWREMSPDEHAFFNSRGADVRLFLDTEFNGYGGSLISMALVTDDGDGAFYEVLSFDEDVDPWVAEHVMPLLGKSPIARDDFNAKLAVFLRCNNDPHTVFGTYPALQVVCDWPADLEHLFESLSQVGASEGFKETIPLSATLLNTPKLNSATPHNALSDAKALRAWWFEMHCAKASP